MNMQLLNQPWAEHERDLAMARRRESFTRAACLALWCAGFLMVGYAIGAIVHGTP